MKCLSTFVVFTAFLSLAKTQEHRAQISRRDENLDHHQITSRPDLGDGTRRRIRKRSHDECREILKGESGQFSSPDYPRSISDNLLCHWTVITPRHEVTLRFHFSDGNDNLCPSTSQGWVFRDGTDPRGIRLQPQCQFHHPEVRGITNAITIIFNSTFWESSSGFRVFYDESQYKSDEDESVLQQSLARNAPLSLEDISPDQITTEMFDVSSPTDVYLRHGTSKVEPIVTDKLDKSRPPNAPSQSVTLSRKVATDTPYSTRFESRAYDGEDFEGKGRMHVGNEPFMFDEVTDESGGSFLPCFFQETSSSGTITSPDYPDKVEGPICTWAITAFSNEVIEITFFDIDIEWRQESGLCNRRFSHLKITTFDENFNQFEHIYCSKESVPIQHISHENLWIDFRSNFGPSRFFSQYQSSTTSMTTVDTGVEISSDSGQDDFLSPSCNLVLHDSIGVIQTPNFPNSYPQNVFCVWTILALPGRFISLRFRVFDIDGPVTGIGKCDVSMIHKYSFVKLSYYSDDQTLTDETFCGSDVPGDVVSRSNRLSVYFQSGHGFGSGFEASYTSLSRRRTGVGFGRSFDMLPYEPYCINFLNETSGYLSYQATFMNESCVWVIQPMVEGIIVLDIESMYFFGRFNDSECDDVAPPVTVDTIDPTTFQPVTWGLCRNTTSERQRFESHGHLNITFDSLDWIILNFNAYYALMTATDRIVTTELATELFLEEIATLSTTKESPATATKLPLLPTVLDLTDEPLCFDTISTSEGQITSPRFPNLPSEYGECSWELVSLDVSLFEIVFTEFHLGPAMAETCNINGNYLDIYVTNDSFTNFPVASDFIGRYCGTYIAEQFHLIAREVRLSLQINANGMGFRARFHRKSYLPYVSTEKTFEVTDFLFEITLPTVVEEYDLEKDKILTTQLVVPEEGVLSSERDEATLSTIKTTVLVDTTDVAQVQDEELITPTTSWYVTDATERTEIITDFVQVDIGKEDDTSVERLPDPFFFSGPMTTTALSSELERVPCEFHIFDQMGKISSPNYPDPYPPNLHCIWLLQFETNQDLSILFTELDLPVVQTSSTHCMAQSAYVKITGWSSLKKELDRFYVCGHKPRKHIHIRGRTVTFEFLANAMPNEHRGFSLNYITRRYFYRGFFNGTFNGSFFGSTTPQELYLTTTIPSQFRHSSTRRPITHDVTIQSDRRPIEVSSMVPLSSSPTASTTELAEEPTIDPRFRLTIFICTGVALVLLVILLVFLIICVRNRSRSSALSLGPDLTAPGDYWSNYRQWARSDYPSSIKYHYEGAGQPSSQSGAGPFRVERERLV